MKYEARAYIIKDNCISKFPYIGRDFSIRYVNELYRKGAISVDVMRIQALSYTSYIQEILVVSESKYKRAIIDEILKAKPAALIEIRKNHFRVEWDPKSLI